MPRYKLTIEYDGTPYSGWQRQEPGVKSVQETLELAFSQFADAPVEVQCAGRTDAGVHARGQVAHVDLPKPRQPFNICEGLNRILLPHPIVIVKAEEVADDFHARFDAKTRHYEYLIVNRSSRLALDAFRAWYVFRPLDIDAMREGASYLLGHHDFTSFRALRCQSKSPEKTLDQLEFHREGDRVIVTTSAKSFLHHQVRNMVGSLVLVGSGKWTPADIKKALDARDRQTAGPAAPAHGLYLTRVEY
jgi:tRNA pseudouridine38-40 synthase